MMLWMNCSTVLKILTEKEINTNQGRGWEDHSWTSGRKQRRKAVFEGLFQKQSVKIPILHGSALQGSDSKGMLEFWALKKLPSEAQNRLKTFNFNQLMAKMHLSSALTSFDLYPCYHPQVQ